MAMTYLLHKQVLTGEVLNVESVLPLEVDLNELDELGNSPLHWAVMGGDLDIVELLLRSGANPNTMCSQGYTPKWSAADFGLHEIELLLNSYGGKIFTDHNFDSVSWSVFKSIVNEPMPVEEQSASGLMNFIKRYWNKFKNRN
jgi:ankyrin repeat protein